MKSVYCRDFVVSCPALNAGQAVPPDLTGTLARYEPSTGCAAATKTIVMHYGGEGQTWLSASTTAPNSQFVARYADATRCMRVVQVLWRGPVEPSYAIGNKTIGWQTTFTSNGSPSIWNGNTPTGTREASRRYAALLAAVFNSSLYHARPPQTDPYALPFCAHGHSGGGSVLAYALVYWGKGQIVDYALFDASPSFASIHAGCTAAQNLTRPICAAYGGGTLQSKVAHTASGAGKYFNRWEPTTGWQSGPLVGACQGTYNAADEAFWKSDSVAYSPVPSDGISRTLTFPKTKLRFWFCGNVPTLNEATGQAHFFVDLVKANNTATLNPAVPFDELADVKCENTAGAAAGCSGEPPWLGSASEQARVKSAMADDIALNCVVRN